MGDADPFERGERERAFLATLPAQGRTVAQNSREEAAHVLGEVVEVADRLKGEAERESVGSIPGYFALFFGLSAILCLLLVMLSFSGVFAPNNAYWSGSEILMGAAAFLVFLISVVIGLLGGIVGMVIEKSVRGPAFWGFCFTFFGCFFMFVSFL